MIDQELYQRTVAAFRIDDFTFFDGDKVHRNYERVAFCDGRTVHPGLDYPKLSEAGLAQLKTHLDVLINVREELVSAFPEVAEAIADGHVLEHMSEAQAIAHLYLKKIEAKCAEFRSLWETAAGDDVAFYAWQQKRHLAPSQELAELTVKVLRSRIRATLAHARPVLEQELVRAALDLQDSLPVVSSSVCTRDVFPMPNRQGMNQIYRMFDGEQFELRKAAWTVLWPNEPYVSLVDLPKSSPKRTYRLTHEQEVRIWKLLVEISDIGWTVKVVPARTGVGLNYAETTLMVPGSRTLQLTYEGMVKLEEHEAGRHLARHAAGLKAGLLLLAEGLEGYGAAEEGITTFSECCVGSSGFGAVVPGSGQHFVLSLAAGCYGRQYNFAEASELYRKALYFLKLALNRRRLRSRMLLEKFGRAKPYQDDPLPSDEVFSIRECAALAEKDAYNVCVRAWRGTTCAGAQTYRKDVVYDLGKMRICRMIRDRGPESARAWLIGKFDPTSDEHIAVLSAIPAVREKLEAAGLVPKQD